MSQADLKWNERFGTCPRTCANKFLLFWQRRQWTFSIKIRNIFLTRCWNDFVFALQKCSCFLLLLLFKSGVVFKTRLTFNDLLMAELQRPCNKPTYLLLDKMEARLNIVIYCKTSFGLCLNETHDWAVLLVMNIDVEWLRADMLWHVMGATYVLSLLRLKFLKFPSINNYKATRKR